MSLPDLLKDVNSATQKYPLEACKPKFHFSSTLSREESSSPDFEWETDSLNSVDEGEAAWDALGRMNSIRRSNRFDKPQLLTVEIQRSDDGFGLELEGRSPPIIHAVSGESEQKGIRTGDRLLEVNGVSVRTASHQEAGRIISGDGLGSVILVLHTVKPPIQPSGKIIYSGWLSKKGGSGLTPRNWRRRWFIVRDDCVAYYYPSPDDTSRPLGAIVMHNYTISKASGDLKRPFTFRVMKGGARTYYLSAETEVEMNRWAQVLTEAANLENREQVHITGSAQNVSVSALSIKDPECHGMVFKKEKALTGWKRMYCILKCQQIFFYNNMSNRTAQGVLNIEGYEISKGKSKEKRHYFQAVPPLKHQKIVNFYAETEIDRERWIDAMLRSVQGPTPLEKT